MPRSTAAGIETAAKTGGATAKHRAAIWTGTAQIAGPGRAGSQITPAFHLAAIRAAQGGVRRKKVKRRKENQVKEISCHRPTFTNVVVVILQVCRLDFKEYGALSSPLPTQTPASQLALDMVSGKSLLLLL